MVYARVNLDDYSNRVLNVIKGKYALKDKSEALNKFVNMYGNEFVEREASENYVKELDNMYDEHIKKYGYGGMSNDELDALCEL